jgi:hypothetical protein
LEIVSKIRISSGGRKEDEQAKKSRVEKEAFSVKRMRLLLRVTDSKSLNRCVAGSWGEKVWLPQAVFVWSFVRQQEAKSVGENFWRLLGLPLSWVKPGIAGAHVFLLWGLCRSVRGC